MILNDFKFTSFYVKNGPPFLTAMSRKLTFPGCFLQNSQNFFSLWHKVWYLHFGLFGSSASSLQYQTSLTLVAGKYLCLISIFCIFPILCKIQPNWLWLQDEDTNNLSDRWLPLPLSGSHLEHHLPNLQSGQVGDPSYPCQCCLLSCHKRMKGMGKWIKRELLEMEEGTGKEEAKQLLQVQLELYMH